MKVLNSVKLKEHLNEKGIKLKRGDSVLFDKNDYYQVVNGYKMLFIDKVENIDEIMNNIDNGIDHDRYKKAYGISSVLSNVDLKNRITDKIIAKYGLASSNVLANKINVIKEINYVHHIYKNDTYYNDFVRMYRFEHALRNILLKYTLLIEENIKRIFIKTLNEDENACANYLTDINNYNTSFKGKKKDNAINSIKKVLELHTSKKSKPIMRKREQDIVVPYWILINEMTLNQTITTIKNLNYDIKMKVFQTCTNEFTNLSLNIFDNSKTSNQKKNEKKSINKFTDILDYVGGFRNMLAHNQPIYNYNIRDLNLSRFGNFTYSKPSIYASNLSHNQVLNQQHSINEALLNKIQSFYGADNYNTVVHNRNIDLSFIIYNVYKINKKLDINTNMLNEIKEIFYSYNIVLDDDQFMYRDQDKIEKLKDYVSAIEITSKESEIISKIDDNLPYKRELHSQFKMMMDYVNSIKRLSSQIKSELIERKYGVFPQNNQYISITGIDKNFFQNIV